MASLATPVTVDSRRVPGIRLHGDRVIRLLGSLLYTAAYSASGRPESCMGESWPAIALPNKTTRSGNWRSLSLHLLGCAGT